jgi:HAD superfamily hydrolase (TIGR01509 family)
LIPEFSVYIFDLDGTLVDSAEDICGAIQGVLASTDKPDVPFEFLKSYIGRHLLELFEHLFPHYTAERIEALIEEYRRAYPLRKHANTRVFPSAAQVLSRLPGRKSTATTKSTATARVVLELFGLLRFFDHVQGTDGFPAKPHPDVLIRALEGLGAGTDECLFIGDSPADMEAARRAGIKCCAATYGYGKRKELAKWKPDYWIGDLAELLPNRDVAPTDLRAPVTGM